MNSIGWSNGPARQAARELRRATADLLRNRARPRRHHLACGMSLGDNTQVCGVNVVSNLGPASICAEQSVLGELLRDRPDARIFLVLTLRATFQTAQPQELVAPCGRCREILYEYAPDAHVVLSGDQGRREFDFVPVRSLLPRPFYRRAPAISQDEC